MIDVVIYTDPEDMYASDELLQQGKTRTLTDIKQALKDLGFEEIGLISLRDRRTHVEEYNRTVRNR